MVREYSPYFDDPQAPEERQYGTSFQPFVYQSVWSKCRSEVSLFSFIDEKVCLVLKYQYKTKNGNIIRLTNEYNWKKIYFFLLYFHCFISHINKIFTFEEIIFLLERCIVKRKTYLCSVQLEKWLDVKKAFFALSWKRNRQFPTEG